jgi:hypothetical protein
MQPAERFGVTGHDRRHTALAFAWALDAEDVARKIERLLDRPDFVMAIGRQQRNGWTLHD